ncbi:hypothetical protein ZIOFF_008409 [Zingiber officinale]|uniref:Uncharacterized protein n=1 Tax=Zingiber officinale TaxID=94328 RepID=A0A8J5M5S9_ZINOF|nr:hypothetical protein ZIOFF_008409 [Zingiber officinale]
MEAKSPGPKKVAESHRRGITIKCGHDPTVIASSSSPCSLEFLSTLFPNYPLPSSTSSTPLPPPSMPRKPFLRRILPLVLGFFLGFLKLRTRFFCISGLSNVLRYSLHGLAISITLYAHRGHTFIIIKLRDGFLILFIYTFTNSRFMGARGERIHLLPPYSVEEEIIQGYALLQLPDAQKQYNPLNWQLFDNDGSPRAIFLYELKIVVRLVKNLRLELRIVNSLMHSNAIAFSNKILWMQSDLSVMSVCSGHRRLIVKKFSHLAILDLLEPWETLDETASLLLSSLSGAHVLNFTGWHAHLLCSILLPKFLFLQQPPSRLLLSSTIQFCRLHPVAAVEALLFPLALRKEGLNAALCDVLARVVKECLHPVHASSACQRLLSANAMDRNPVLLARHRESICDEVVWTESMFVLFQHILNQKVSLPPDTVDCLASAIDEKASEFSRSLKFGNFMLCFVTKCDGALKHKILLEKAAGRTQTFVTKSILSKLNVMQK